MNQFLKLISSLFRRNKKPPPKIKVCWDFLAEILGDLRFLNDEEQNILGTLDYHDPKVLLEIIREFIVPQYNFFSDENREKIKNSLAYYIATDSKKLDRVFPSRLINLEASGKLFYTLVWKELFGNYPEQIDPDCYEEDCSSKFIMSLYDREENDKVSFKYIEPSLSNVIANLNTLHIPTEKNQDIS